MLVRRALALIALAFAVGRAAANPPPAAPFSDLLAGAVRRVDPAAGTFALATAAGTTFTVHLTGRTRAALLRNLGEPERTVRGPWTAQLSPGRALAVYGTFFPAQAHRFEAQEVWFPASAAGLYRFEEPGWWVDQLRQLADFYMKSQLPQGPDWRSFRTARTRDGGPAGSPVQEATTISRLVYGLATAYLLTGDDRYREAAERGAEYLRARFRVEDPGRGAWWAHAVDAATGARALASAFKEDRGTVPLYEQIYALAGPAQAFRVSGDPALLADLRATQDFIEARYRDRERGGYFSHLAAATLSPHDPALGENRARKNWNSIGDHAPAYLINLHLAAGDPRDAARLLECGRTIVTRFVAAARGPFVPERFHADWRPDPDWGWQKDAAIVGHDLKIVWTLLRLDALDATGGLSAAARRFAPPLAAAGRDLQRGGWYDAIELAGEGRGRPPFVWHDRKMWWQQEQGILAHYLLTGRTGDAAALALARETAAFYNLWFLDHDEGAVHASVHASGIPHVRGRDRLKAAHWISGYHAFELCYLAHVYLRLLVQRAPIELHFRPVPRDAGGGLLRVAPDLLPAGRVRLAAVWIDGVPHAGFDPAALTVRLPPRTRPVHVRVRLAPGP